MNAKKSIGLVSLMMLMLGAVDGVSNLPSIAIFGQQLVFFFIFASLLFLFPTGLISAELCAQDPENSGVYGWSKKAFGSKFSSLVIWLQWINTMVWFPTCLTTFVGTAAYIIDPKLIHHPAYLVLTSLTVFWIMTFLNMKGIQYSAKIASWGTSIGMVLPMILIIGLSILWVITGKPLALHLNEHAIFPNMGSEATWTSLTAVITAFLGMELATVHAHKVKNAHKVFPKALGYAIILIILTMGLGSLAVSLIVPHHKIELVAGTIQVLSVLFQGFHIPWMAIVLGCLLLFGSLGAMVNWLISPANGLAQAAKDQYLPKTLSEENKNGVPYKVLIMQGVVVTIVSCAFFLMPSVNGSYWLLLDLSTELYVAMYVLMFIAALKLTIKTNKIKIIPCGKVGAYLTCIIGLVGCSIAFVVGFFPPSNINVGTHWHYIALFGGGFLLMCSPALGLHLYKAKINKATK